MIVPFRNYGGTMSNKKLAIWEQFWTELHSIIPPEKHRSMVNKPFQHNALIIDDIIDTPMGKDKIKYTPSDEVLYLGKLVSSVKNL